MPKLDRGMIKWQPFDSVTNSKQMIRNVLMQKAKIRMPSLSDEQRSDIEEKIILAFYGNSCITIEYFYEGKILKINDKIKKIDSTYHKIYFNNKIILFEQILNAYLSQK